MIAGIVWPAPDPLAPPPSREWLEALRLTCANTIRINLPTDCDVSRRTAPILEAGYQVLGLLDLPMGFRPAGYAAHAADVARRCLAITDYELGNEPAGGPDARHSAEDYALLAWMAADAIRKVRPDARIWLFAEAWDVVHGRPQEYHASVRRVVPRELYDGVTVHLYREPREPDWTPRHLDGRREEWQRIQEAVGEGVPILVSEVGWRITRPPWYCPWRPTVTPIMQALHLRREVAILRALGAAGVCIYTYASEPGEGFGLFTPDLRPRMAARHLFARPRVMR